MTHNLITRSIAIGCDHAGLDLKEFIKAELSAIGVNVIDCGTNSNESVDYPDYAKKVANSIINQETQMGILICGTGIGISIAANRFPEIRCALCHDVDTSRITRQHNNSNIIAIGARNTDANTAIACIKAFLSTEFEGGRHQQRIDKMS